MVLQAAVRGRIVGIDLRAVSRAGPDEALKRRPVRMLDDPSLHPVRRAILRSDHGGLAYRTPTGPEPIR